MLKPHPFHSLTRAEAQAKLAQALAQNIKVPAVPYGAPYGAVPVTVPDLLETAQLKRLFFEGEHWQNGAGWAGPIPAQNDRAYNDVKEEIRRAFCSRNVVREVVRRRRNGVLGREPAWSITTLREVSGEAPLTPEESALLAEANAALTSWWDRREGTRLLRRAHDKAALGEAFALRLYVPRGLLQENPQSGALEVPPGDLRQSLDLIHVQITEPGQAGVVLDKKTKLSGAVYNEQDDECGTSFTEIVFSDGALTTLRVVSSDESSNEVESRFEFAGGGRLTIYEPHCEALVTRQTLENQLAINLAKTLQNRHMIAANFLERIITDAMPPGEWIEDPANTGKQIYKLKPFKLGSGTTNFLNAAEYANDKTGEVHYGSPQVHFREPGSVDVFVQGKRDPYQDILEECDQMHILISGDPTASGESRKQARDIFKKHCEGVKADFDPLGRWLLETPLLMAAQFARRAGAFAACRADFNCLIDTGPRSADEQRADGQDVSAGHLSLETKLVRDGIEDPSAEQARIQGERETSLSASLSAPLTAPQRAQIVHELAAAGAGIESAALVAGFSEDDAARLGQSDFVPPSEA